jgi:membrane associated rhomboid family serine protease
MTLVLPIWPRTTRFPWATVFLILVNALVFIVGWPMEKRQASVVSADELSQSARELTAILESPDNRLTEDERKVLSDRTAPFPSPALTALFHSLESRKDSLSSQSRYRWDSAYPLFQSYSRSLDLRPQGNSLYRAYGFRPSKDWWPGILSHQFLHAGFLHLLGNMLFFWAIGPLVEAKSGAGILTFLYLAGGMAAAFVQTQWSLPENVLMVGASGAVSALMGYSLTRLPSAKVKVFYLLVFFITARYGVFDSPLWFILPLWVLEQMTMALLTRGSEWVQVGYGAHLGGFAFGAFLGLLHRLLFQIPTQEDSIA